MNSKPIYRLSGPEAFIAFRNRLTTRGFSFYEAWPRADQLAMRYLRWYGALPIRGLEVVK